MSVLPDGISPLMSQADAVQQSLKYIQDRQSGKITTLKTCYPNLNKLVGGGFEPNTIAIISGLSGSGKSTLSKRMIYSITKNCLAEGRKCVSLCFNFEMLAHKTIGRELANKTGIGLTELYSNYEPVKDSVIKQLEKEAEELSKCHINYVEEPKNSKVISDTILHYWKVWCGADKSKTMIVEIDHTMLTRGRDGENDKGKIDSLMEQLIQIKKKIASEGGNIFMLVLSQMNRDIKSSERQKPTMHRPMTSDLFQSSTMEFAADYIIIAHNPSKLNLPSYTEEERPVTVLVEVTDKNTGEITEEKRPFIYFHLLKNRDNESDLTATMIADLQYFKYIPVSPSEYITLRDDFNNLGTCKYKTIK